MGAAAALASKYAEPIHIHPTAEGGLYEILVDSSLAVEKF
jgi:hypothetical protein